MNETGEKTALGQILEEATELAARALAISLAHAFDSYVPRRYADLIKARMAIELLGQVDCHYPRPNYATEH